MKDPSETIPELLADPELLQQQIKALKKSLAEVTLNAGIVAERRKAEEDLRIFRASVDNSSDAIGFSTPQGYHYYQNRAFNELFGPVGENPPETVYVDPEVGREVFRTIMAGEQWTGEVRMYGKDRQILDILLRAYPNRDDRGNITALVGIHTDITERKRAEEKLIHVMKAVESTSDAIGISDPQGHHFYQNKALTELSGYATAEEMEAAGGGAVIVRDPQIAGEMFAAIMSGKSWTGELELVTKQGTVVPAFERADAIKDQDGNLIGLIGIITDMRERKQAEEELRKTTALLASMMESTTDIIYAKDLQGRYTLFNPAAERAFDRKAAEVLGKDDNALYSPSLARAIREDDLGVLAAGEVQTFEDVVTLFPGNEAVYLLTKGPLFDAGKNPVGLFGIARDITAHRRAEEDYRMLFREMLDGFALHEILCDTRGEPVDYRFLAVNPAFENLTGLKARDILGKTVLEVLPGTERHWIETYGKVALTGEPVAFENYAVALEKHFAVTAFQPAPRQFACIFVDITERKRVAETEIKLREQLLQAQRIESVGRLAGGVAHDFNNMLGVILGYAELALARVQPGQPLHASLEEIRKAAERSADLTRRLLAFARKQTISPRVLDLNETVAGMLKMLQRLIGEDIHLDWSPCPSLWPLKLDPSQVDQILANLCVNSRDAINGVGKLTIETGNVRFDADYCADHAEFLPGEYVLLAVSDNGSGMDKQTREHMFEPFFTTKATGVGTGLGLAMVHGIVKQNNGFITVYSEPGEGTTIRIYLPRYDDNSKPVRCEELPEPLPSGPETLLIVEDEPSLLDLSRIILEAQGYQVLIAETPGEAIRLAEEHPGDIHLLVTDVVMPGMNGRELARRILSLYPDIRRLFMSGYTANVIAHQGILDEGVHFIQKPFSRKSLIAKVREVLDQK